MKPSLHDSMQSCISGRPLRKHLSRRSKHYTASRCMRVHELFLLSTTHHPVPLVCADAYFQLGGVRCNATDLSNSKVSIRPEGVSNLKNGLPAEHQKFCAAQKVPTTYSGSSIRVEVVGTSRTVHLHPRGHRPDTGAVRVSRQVVRAVFVFH